MRRLLQILTKLYKRKRHLADIPLAQRVIIASMLSTNKKEREVR